MVQTQRTAILARSKSRRSWHFYRYPCPLWLYASRHRLPYPGLATISKSRSIKVLKYKSSTEQWRWRRLVKSQNDSDMAAGPLLPQSASSPLTRTFPRTISANKHFHSDSRLSNPIAGLVFVQYILFSRNFTLRCSQASQSSQILIGRFWDWFLIGDGESGSRRSVPGFSGVVYSRRSVHTVWYFR